MKLMWPHVDAISRDGFSIHACQPVGTGCIYDWKDEAQNSERGRAVHGVRFALHERRCWESTRHGLTETIFGALLGNRTCTAANSPRRRSVRLYVHMAIFGETVARELAVCTGPRDMLNDLLIAFFRYYTV